MSIKYTFGRIVIEDKVYTSDCIICKDRIVSNWWRNEGHLLQLCDIEDILDNDIKTLIVGTGYNNMMKVDDSIRIYCKNNEIILVDFPTQRAIDYYEHLKDKDRAILALHLTC